MNEQKNMDLDALLEKYECIRQIVHSVLDVWPEHHNYISKSLTKRDPDILETTEILAQASLLLAGNRIKTIAQNYRWTCDRLREEEIYFHRNGEYRLKTFEEADKEVYSNAEYMEKYVDGLLFSQVLWSNHASSCDFYFREIAKNLPSGRRMLEIGPGHGMMVYLAMRKFNLSEVTAWDISPVSIEQTREALAKMSITGANLEVRDIMAIPEGTPSADLVVLSEVLEHLEDPKTAMRKLRPIVADDGLIFINVPINSPSPDHLYLMETLDDARSLLRDTGFEIISEGAFATQATKLERALRIKISVSVCMIGRPV